MMGSGTTRDVIEWLNDRRPKAEKIEYWGGDLRKGFDLQQQNLPGRFDFVWIHPPYFNIIRYSESPADLSNEDCYGLFVQKLALCLRHCHAALVPGGRLAVLIGDVRRRGCYIPLIREVLMLDGDVGDLRSVIIKLQHNCRSDSKRYGHLEDPKIAHEYCCVFKKRVRARHPA